MLFAMELNSGSFFAAGLLLAAVLLPAAGALAIWALSCWGQKYPGNGWRNIREGILFVVNGLSLVCVLALLPFAGLEFRLPQVCGMGLSFGIDGCRWVLAVLGTFLWLMASLFGREYLNHASHKMRYYTFFLLTESGVLGTFLSADLYTAFVFFEIMSIASWVLVAQEETPGARRAADSYLAYAVVGGLVTLMGLFLLFHDFGTLRFSALREAGLFCPPERRITLYVAGGLTLFGFATKAGMWPLHTWLPKAHPVAPATASALLSGIITKAGLFGVLVLAGQLFWQDEAFGIVILLLGTITMVTGAMLAVFSVDLKRTLACSSMSQIGFILVGVGMSCFLGSENGTAVAGLMLHICSHALFKLTLFLCAGCIVMNVHKLNLNDIRGFGRGKPLLCYAFSMGALGLAGVPLCSGYISKTLLHESIVEGIAQCQLAELDVRWLQAIEWLFLISGGLTAAYMAKLFFCLFIEKNMDPAVQKKFDAIRGHYMTRLSGFVLLFCGTLLPLLGLTPHLTMEPLAALCNGFFASSGLDGPVSYFSVEALKGAGISLAIGAGVYLAFVRTLLVRHGVYYDCWPSWLDLEDRIYRPLLLKVLPFIGAVLARIYGSLIEWARQGFAFLLLRAGNRSRRIVPGRDAYFAQYNKAPQGTQGFSGSLAYSLMMFGFGLVAIFIYLLLRL